MAKDYYKLVEERITAATKAVIQNPENEEKLYELLLCGHVAYKGGLGLPHNAVHAAIALGIQQSKEI
jgi:hypothetical protein